MAGNVRNSRPLVVGVGNERRGDDRAGLLVVRRLRRLGVAALAELIEHPGDGAGLIELWQGRERVIVVDAVDAALQSEVAWFDVSASRGGFETTATSTHAIGLAQAVELARALGTLPPKIEICAIAAARFDPFSSASTAVERACAAAAAAIADKLAREHRAAHPEIAAELNARIEEAESCTK